MGETLRNKISLSLSLAMLSDVSEYIEGQDRNFYRLTVDSGQAPVRVKSETGSLSALPKSRDQQILRNNIPNVTNKKKKYRLRGRSSESAKAHRG
eukprot:TRINITY_DN3199_c0_g1_i1.p1 TRINITY_DN3199_c0_g1~~TRINITY_DN3199_c0_g1_i1.p1  ORF type:complete len:95 (+),score=26.29 TRINITY_DN3199_c0_g1_i1:59-343(+)